MNLSKQIIKTEVVLITLLISSQQVLAAADYASEKRWADEVMPSIVVVHGLGIHPVWASLSMTQEETYDGIHVPALDLYGGNDLPHVLLATKQRKLSLQKNPYSKQKVTPETNHFFASNEEDMVDAVKEFFDGFKK